MGQNKSKKKKLIWLSFFFIISLGILFLLIGYFLSNHKYTNKDFAIPDYFSSVDKDDDGIDDNTDILNNAKKYIAKKPKYKSKYYATGYPNDEYGVCTDVVAFSLLDAGYDLQELVNNDILNNLDIYHITRPDKNIDFRRVKNLKIYFVRNAINLTTDLNVIEDWQGGDIVVFPNHIGIISNYRNKKGIPYLIHHANPYQINYEEDVLQNYEILGHYRMS